jgi:hypothetical protein
MENLQKKIDSFQNCRVINKENWECDFANGVRGWQMINGQLNFWGTVYEKNGGFPTEARTAGVREPSA